MNVCNPQQGDLKAADRRRKAAYRHFRMSHKVTEADGIMLLGFRFSCLLKIRLYWVVEIENIYMFSKPSNIQKNHGAFHVTLPGSIVVWSL